LSSGGDDLFEGGEVESMHVDISLNQPGTCCSVKTDFVLIWIGLVASFIFFNHESLYLVALPFNND